MLNDDSAPKMTRIAKESALLVVVLLLAQLPLWMRFAPRQHHDQGCYLEPAILLASVGSYSAPGIQHHDPLGVVGYYCYLPGYALILGVWIRMFGHGPISLTTYAHLTHLIFLVATWWVMRLRFRVTVGAAAFAVVSIFPFFNQGRPDMTALLVGAVAWLIAPSQGFGVRFVATSVLLGAAVMISPGFGSSAAATVGAYMFLANSQPWPVRVARPILSAVIALATLCATSAAFIERQDAWDVAWQQWINHIELRGSELNEMPNFATRHEWIYSVIPFGLLTLVPLVLALVTPRRAAGAHLRIAAACCLVGSLVWFATSKTFFLMHGHFAILGRPVFQAAMACAPARWMRGVGWIAMALFTLIHLHMLRDTFAVATDDRPAEFEAAAQLSIPLDAVIAVDADYVPVLYRNGKILHYEVFILPLWKKYVAQTPEELRRRYPIFQSGPRDADWCVVSQRSLDKFGPPDPSRYRRLTAEEAFGTDAVAASRPIVFVRRDGS